jgi:hypothetical protein|tara:strand:+ start:239 stop:760 length:522 start_codon:yes stop_codon:yes gene_type:complete
MKIVNKCTLIDWNPVLEEIKDNPGLNAPFRLPLDQPEVKEMLDDLKDYPPESIEWFNYYPGVDFNVRVVKEFSDLVNKECVRAWISKINPGKTAPWHWDYDANEQEYLKKGELVRYHASISKPFPGHVFIVGDQCFYNEPQGTIHEWDDYRSYHAGANCGVGPKFLFNFLGYR